jgi:hypothetical protein
MLNAFEVSPALFASLKIAAPSYAGAPAYLDTAAAAKLIRHLLKAAFPAVKFSVTTSRYSGGSSINVKWTDGPTYRVVDEMVSALEGKGFDGSQDLEYAKAPFSVNGVLVRTYCYIHCNRHTSERLKQRAAEQVATYYGVALPPRDQWSHTPGPNGMDYWNTLVYQACEDRTRFQSA